ncbi:uncharacterized protein LOC127247777 isoform X2 [Andrographis paniculata]|uniref:uncharacterized protein LOC127247777 isoform X2 n=1 Tax=Andrographis paniculata TaxID=175694 RepID=UPI0021E6E988|nr:uncharacterized protein LOC127247777 isoform X2 [Andrographis paniculata]
MDEAVLDGTISRKEKLTPTEERSKVVMAKCGHERWIFPLTSLQIGDMQSYFAHLNLFLAFESGKFYILVENRPRSKEHMSDPTHWWQLMVTKSRLSPFVTTRARKEEKMLEELTELQGSSAPGASLTPERKWFALTDALTLSRHRALQPVHKLRNALIENSKLLHQTFSGFIVFEVTWNNVRGINYLNELQTDTLLAIEAKLMRRWEFDSIAQAAASTSTWFSGTVSEHIVLKKHLDAAIGEVYHDVQERLPMITEDDMDDVPNEARNDSPSCTSCSNTETTENKQWQECEEPIETTVYKNVLILFRFNDPELPFKLKDIIMSELWLLTLLEAGLPPWAIFLQSYPGFSRLYRPWMCPLARALYVLISFVTVAIGFYDLYKNIPLLKATASHLFGPLFDWIEAWEMVSRIQYLGTMLFLHNFQKAVKCFLVVARTIFSFLSVFILPMARPFIRILEFFLPLVSMLMDIAEDFFSVIWMVVETTFTVAGDILEILLLPFWYVFATAWNIVMSLIYPIVWMVFYAPFKLVHGLCRILAFFCAFTYNFLGTIWLSARGLFQLSRGVETTTVITYEASLWRSLWNDLFSQIFRALRSILNGFAVFFMACNRHRLSIYNHVKEFIKILVHAMRSACSKGTKTNHTQTQQSDSQLLESRRRLSNYELKSTKSI